MTRYQILLLPTLAAAIFVLGGALTQKPAASQPPDCAAPSAASDPQALAILDQAIAALDPQNVAWLETKVWQQASCEDFAYQACGRLLVAPGERIRFDLNVQVGKTLGELRMVNDGTTLWQSIKIGGDSALVKHWELPLLNDNLKTPADLAQARAQLAQSLGFSGLAPMLAGLRQRLQGAQVQAQQWQGRAVHVVAAAWPENTVAPAGIPDFVAPRFQLRQCRIFLDAQSKWPHRIEWWGVDKTSERMQLVMQTEYRNPVLNQPLSAARCAGEFTFGAY